MSSFDRVPNSGNVKRLDRMRRAFRFLEKIEAFEGRLLKPFRDKSLNGQRFPGLYKRAGAYALDALFAILMFVVTIQLAKYLIADSLYVVANVAFAFIAFGMPLYYALSHFFKGCTLGKAAFDMKVTSTKENKLSLFQSLLRELAKLFLMPLAPISLVALIFSKKRQALHDFIATTQINVTD